MSKQSFYDRVKKWWNNNGYIVLRVLLFPFWIVCIIDNKIQKKIWNNINFSTERTLKILEYYIPRRAEWCEDDNVLYFFDNGYGWEWYYAKKYVKLKDKKYWKRYNGFCGGLIKECLVHDFELEGFEKRILQNCDGRIEIKFKKIEG